MPRLLGRVGSSPAGRTGWPFGGGLAKIEYVNVPVVELVDTPDLGSGVLRACGFESHRAHWRQVFLAFPLAARAPLVL